MIRNILFVNLCFLLFSVQGEVVIRQEKIESVGLFKNGIAVIKSSIAIDKNGIYSLEDLPLPVHGTFWIESDARVITRVISKEVEVPLAQKHLLQYHKIINGRDVVVSLKNKQEISGKVISLKGKQEWSTNYQPQRNPYFNFNNNSLNLPQNVIMLKNENGQVIINTSEISHIVVRGEIAKIKVKKQVMMFDVKGASKESKIFISYLTKGAAWMPSYNFNVKGSVLKIQQKAALKNEWRDFTNAEVFLISGFPSIKYAHIDSPLTNSSLSSFFTQLNSARGNNSQSSLITQNTISFNRAPNADSDRKLVLKGESNDIYYHSIGRISMKDGESMALQTAAGKGAYKRIVQWTVKKKKKNYSSYEMQQSPDLGKDIAWDALSFKNPFAFPMTTAPVIVSSNGKFVGQQMSYFINSKADAIVKVTKALSVDVEHNAYERGDVKRQRIYIFGSKCEKITYQGQMNITNHRVEDIELFMTCEFNGELIDAGYKPAKKLLTDGGRYNRKTQLKWKIRVKGGSKLMVKYQYTSIK